MINYFKIRLPKFYILTVLAFLFQYISGGKFDGFMFGILIMYVIILPVPSSGNILGIEADAGNSVMINIMVVVLLYYAVIYLLKCGIKKMRAEHP